LKRDSRRLIHAPDNGKVHMNAFLAQAFEYVRTHVAYAGLYSLHGLNYANECWFQEAIEQNVCISDIFSGLRNEPHFVIAVTRCGE
jgi:hypothetical protein